MGNSCGGCELRCTGKCTVYKSIEEHSSLNDGACPDFKPEEGAEKEESGNFFNYSGETATIRVRDSYGGEDE